MPPKGYRTMRRSALESRKLRHASHAAAHAYWRMLLGTDPFGRASAHPGLLAAAIAPAVPSLGPEQLEPIVAELAELGLIVTWQDEAGDAWLQVVGFDDMQLAEFRRKRGSATCPEPPDGLVSAAASLPSCPHQDVRRRSEEDKLGSNEPLSESPQGQTSDADDIRRVFDRWVELTWNGRGRRPLLSPTRASRLRARRREGWSADDLIRAVEGYCADPWWNGTAPDSKGAHLELALRLGTNEKVELGIQLRDAQEASDLSEYVRPGVVPTMPSRG